jgi:P-type Mg2+ transporter
MRCDPEGMLERCAHVLAAARARLDAEFAAGNRVVAVAFRLVPSQPAISEANKRGLQLRGLLRFLDPPMATARGAVIRLHRPGIT